MVVPEIDQEVPVAPPMCGALPPLARVNRSIHGPNKDMLVPPYAASTADLQPSRTGFAPECLLPLVCMSRPEYFGTLSLPSVSSVYERTWRRKSGCTRSVSTVPVRRTPRLSSSRNASAICRSRRFRFASLDPQIYEELLETSLSGCRNPSIHGSNKGILMPPPSGPMDDLQSSKTGLAATRLLASLWITRPEKSDLPSRFSLFSVYERTSRRNVSWILRVFALSVRCTPRPASLKYASANACR
ncbi:uncharacterized protein MKK02DRAFT_29287 [Dioszegia hungarica]|uniref:Uncharacterized protein n=1 Tax=Dioszegia hungarica TaxID=4972 RepID=A0AA38HEQ0_9TREE|nr:uncharacterized protein MKK02DRAFT_29287 [Dioszegia hungarica]KAI9639175.1 hypothetical protein MKK02DRAFT_29287 [Dioszegia hungarica]